MIDVKGVIERFIQTIKGKFIPALIKTTETFARIQRQTATISAQRTRASKLDYRKVKSQRRNMGHWRRSK